MKPTLKVKYLTFFIRSIEDRNNFWFTIFLNEHFNVIFVDDLSYECEVDLLFFGAFIENLKSLIDSYNCLKIFYTGENIKPIFNNNTTFGNYVQYDENYNKHYGKWHNYPACDISMSFYYTEHNNVRIPFYLEDYHNEMHRLLKENRTNFKKRTKFCCFIVKNPTCEFRNDFFIKLNTYKKVDSIGPHLNNHTFDVGNPFNTNEIHYKKLKFISDYKFIIAMENTKTLGYTTEKIVDAMMVGTIPIYWGNPLIHKEFNEQSFINVNGYEDIDSVINNIIQLDNNDAMYDEMQKQSCLVNNKFCDDQILDEQLKKVLVLINNFIT